MMYAYAWYICVKRDGASSRHIARSPDRIEMLVVAMDARTYGNGLSIIVSYLKEPKTFDVLLRNYFHFFVQKLIPRFCAVDRT